MRGSMADIQCATAEIRRGKNKEEEQTTGQNILVMVALWNRADLYIFMLWFVLLLLLLLLLFSSPNLSRRRLDVCHTSTHGVALVRI